MELCLNEKSVATLEKIKQMGRDSWGGETGERRAADIEKLLTRALPEYAEALELTQDEVLEALESHRGYCAVNYYQDARLPPISGIPVHATLAEFKDLIPSGKFRCPSCGGTSTDPYDCDSGVIRDGSPCNWKAYGLFGTLGRGYRCIVKETFLEHPVVHEIFMPVEFEPALSA